MDYFTWFNPHAAREEADRICYELREWRYEREQLERELAYHKGALDAHRKHVNTLAEAMASASWAHAVFNRPPVVLKTP